MATVSARRAGPLLPTMALSVCICFLAARLVRHAATFVGSPSLRASAVSRQVSRKGFKEEFDSWRSSLSEDELAMVTEQAQGEFNKAFRKSDKYMQDLPADKIKSFSSILGKFFENEAEDWKKEEAAMKTPDYDGLLKKAGEKKMNFSLRSMIVEIDRDAERRYQSAIMKIAKAQREGKGFPQSSPMKEKLVFKNNDTESHENLLNATDLMNKIAEKEALENYEKIVVPEIGEDLEFEVPQVLQNQMASFGYILNRFLAKNKANSTKEEYKELESKALSAYFKGVTSLSEQYFKANAEVEKDAREMKAMFRSQEKFKGDTTRTKADVLKDFWEELPKHTDKPVPPLDEELLAELAEYPAIEEGAFMHPWGTADRLWKSEAIDAFGGKYLLGVFETKDEAKKAFKDWNEQYEEARATMRSELEQWGKQEQARLDADPEPLERIKKVLESARR